MRGRLLGSPENQIQMIVVKNRDDVTFYFNGSEEPFGVDEFVKDTPTRRFLEAVEAAIIEFNFRKTS